MASRSICGDDHHIRPIVTLQVVNTKTGETTKIYALLDTGSDRDFLTSATARRLGLELRDQTITTTTVHGPKTEIKKLADFQIESNDGSYRCEVKDAIIDNLPTIPSDVPPAKRDLSNFAHLHDVEFDKIDGDVDAVIGVAHASAFVGGDCRKGGKDDPLAVKTDFGWTLLGPSGGKKNKEKNVVVSNWVKVDEAAIREEVMQAFSDELAGHKDFEGESKQQRDAIRQLEEGTFFNKEAGKYSAPLPFKGGRDAAMEKINDADSRAMALKRLASLKRNLSKFPDKKEKVFAEMEKFLKEGAVEEIVDDHDAAKAEKPVWTLPIHIVSKDDKCRFCMDARANADGTCLNCHLIGVMNQLTPIQQPLRDFRDPLYAATFDIRAFFHQVLVNVPDRDCFRFFFYGDREMTWIRLYRWAAHIFGAASSPTVTAFVLRHHADQIARMFDEYIVDTIKRRFYVDDGSGGKNSVADYLKFVEDMNAAMALGGFELSKWKFSHPTLVGEPAVLEGEHLTKFLGLRWNLMTDTLGIAVDEFNFPIATTPRHFVKIAARIFDVEGWFSPFIVTGRHLVQAAMTGDWGWDKPVDPELAQRFNDWAASIKHLANFYVPRCWNLPSTIGCIPELHIFSDAGEDAYGAVAYRVVKGVDGVIHSHIICSKGHVVPKDPRRSSHHGSIPRLELVAAVKALDIRKNVEKLAARASDITGEKFSRVCMWVDSTAVLKQLFDTTTPPKGFVGNRVSRLQDETKSDEWYYVPTDDNPADLITKGIGAFEAEKWKLFHTGPDFLRMGESFWPEMITNRNPTPPDPVIVYATATTSPSSEAIIKMAEGKGDWFDKIHGIASVIRAVNSWRKIVQIRKERKTTSTRNFEHVTHVCGADVREAEKILVRAIQDRHYAPELARLRRLEVNSPTARDEVARKSKIYPLNPFLSTDGIIRVGSRLVHANIDDEAKFPAVLPKDDPHIGSLIRHYHRDAFHMGPNQTHSAIRQRFWITNGLATVKKIISRCPDCQRASKPPMTQKMAPLPESRVVDSHAWATAGVDMMGPFLVKKNGSRANHKTYVALFTCFTTRSIHIEMVEKMDAESFIQALERFTARCPGLKHLVSDNGTNFLGSRSILSKEAQELERTYAPKSHVVPKKEMKTLFDVVRPRIIRRGIDWSFIPPYASHYGGVWERMVGIVKKHLAKVSSGAVLNDRILETALVQIEGVVNDRPLTAESVDPADWSDMRPIRPRHILSPSFMEDLTWNFVGDRAKNADVIRHQLEEARERVRAFWASWKQDYLQMLANRQKWRKTTVEMKVGELVLIVDNNKKRSAWDLARVVEVDEKDSHGRKFLVRKADGSTHIRDCTSLVHLELDED